MLERRGHVDGAALVPPILWGGPAGPPSLLGVSVTEVVRALQAAKARHPEREGPALWSVALLALTRVAK